MQILTIGYEGASPEAFDQTLDAAGVQLVVDVRAVAVSRKAGFSKSALSARLAGRGVDYLHLRDLGDPKAGREAARAGRHDEFERIFEQHLTTAAARVDLATLAEVASQQRVALLCYEADPALCHRSMVAKVVAHGRESAIRHLTVEDEADVNRGRSRAHDHPCEGAPAA